jgi:D-proline reductase (dithiol) PrdB
MAWYHQFMARFLDRVPFLRDWMTDQAAGHIPGEETLGTPFAPCEADPFGAKMMLITTGGVHTPDQEPFDMSSSEGDASYRLIPRDETDFAITHDYYDHRDADRDINCLFPLPLARQLHTHQLIGPLSLHHASFMGHIEDPLVPELIEEQLPRLWDELEDRPDLILLSPG